MPYRHLGPATAPVIYRPRARGHACTALFTFAGLGVVLTLPLLSMCLRAPDPLTTLMEHLRENSLQIGLYMLGLVVAAAVAWRERRVVVHIIVDPTRIEVVVRPWPWSGSTARFARTAVAGVDVVHGRHQGRDVAELGLRGRDGSFARLLSANYGRTTAAIAGDGQARLGALVGTWGPDALRAPDDPRTDRTTPHGSTMRRDDSTDVAPFA